MTPVRVLLADDHTLVRAGLRLLLESLPGYSVVAEAADGAQVQALVAQCGAQIVLMDISMPTLGGLEATARLRQSHPEVKVLILSMHQSDAYVRQALRLGASAYLLKDAAPQELELALAAVQRGEIYLSPTACSGVLANYAQRPRAPAPGALALTPRQRQVLGLIAEGLSNKEMARRLNLSLKTIDTHRTLLMRQLDIHEVAGLVRWALRNGLVTLP